MKVVAAVSAASEEMPSVLAVPVDELIIGLIAFLIVFGALGKFALPKIKATLDERADAIEGGLQRAEEAQAEASRVLEEYKEQLASAREEASAIRTQAQADRSSMVEEAKNEARHCGRPGHRCGGSTDGCRSSPGDEHAHPTGGGVVRRTCQQGRRGVFD